MTGDVAVPEVLFVCVHNAGRSQMAEAFLNHYARGRVRALSAGTEPGGGLNPAVVQAMDEVGIDLSGHRPKLLTPEMAARASRVITMGWGVAESCPAGFLRIDADWGLDDLRGQPIQKVREIRDGIREKVFALLAAMEDSRTAAECLKRRRRGPRPVQFSIPARKNGIHGKPK